MTALTSNSNTPSFVVYVLSISGLCLSLVVHSHITSILPLGDTVRTLSIMSVLAIGLIGVIWTVLQGRVLVASVTIILIASIWGYVFLFSYNYGTRFTFFSGGEYYSGTLVGIYYLAFKFGCMDSILRRLNK